MRLEVEGLTCGYKFPIINGISFHVEPGEVACVLGVNGVGKTTLFKTILGQLPRLGGRVSISGQDLSQMPVKQIARIIGYVPQAHIPPFPYRVLDVVTTGRTPHLSLFSAPSRCDEEIAYEVLEQMQIGSLSERVYTELSGGERQLVLIARALAGAPKILVMDEPASNLDFGNQMRMIRQIRLLADMGLAVMLTSHNPDHVLQCATKAVLLYGGARYAVDTPEKLINRETMREIYSIEAEVKRFEREGKTSRVCVPWI